MFGKDPESRDFVIGLTLTCLIAGGFFAYAHWGAPAKAELGAIQDPHLQPRPRQHERVHHASADAPRESSSVIATVYECHDENGRVLSDQPCGEGARVREVALPNLMTANSRLESSAGAVAPTDSARPRIPRARLERAVSRKDRTCASIDEQVDHINARMRRGYTDWEGEQLRQRLRELSDQRWEADCRK